MKTIFYGVCTALVTPFKDNGDVDFDALRGVIEYQVESKVDALCILGTTGEAATMSWDEKLEVAKFSYQVVAGRVPIIFGIGGNNPKEIIRFGLAVKKLAPKVAVMCTPPYYNKCTQDAAVKYFHDIANAVKLPFVVYNVPGRTGMNLEPATMQKIVTNKYVVGIKEASGNMGQIIEVVRLCHNVAVYCGDDGLSLPCYAVGCKGIISVASNVRPYETRTIWLGGNHKLFLDELKYYKALFCEVNPAPVKYAMHLMGMCGAFVRPPLTVLSEKSIMAHEFLHFFKPASNRKHDGDKQRLC